MFERSFLSCSFGPQTDSAHVLGASDGIASLALSRRVVCSVVEIVVAVVVLLLRFSCVVKMIV